MANRSRRGFPVRMIPEPDWNPLWFSGGGGGGGSRSLFDRLVGGMQSHLDEMERMRVVLLDAYPLLALEDEGAGGWQARKGTRRGGGGGDGDGPGWSVKPCPGSSGQAHRFSLDLSGFSPEEVTVSLDGRKLTVQGKHERRAESEEGCVAYDARQLRRQLLLPDDADLEAVSCALALDGRLCIEAPRRAPPPPQERVIPVRISRAPLGEDGAPKEEEEEERKKEEEEGEGPAAGK